MRMAATKLLSPIAHPTRSPSLLEQEPGVPCSRLLRPEEVVKQLNDACAARMLVLEDAPGAWEDHDWQRGFDRFEEAAKDRGRLDRPDTDNAASQPGPAWTPPDDRPIWNIAKQYEQDVAPPAQEHPRMVCVLTELVRPLAGLDRLSLSNDRVTPLVSFDLVRCAAGIDKHPKTGTEVFFELDGRDLPVGQHNDGGATAVYRHVKELMEAFDRRLPELPDAVGPLPEGTHMYVHWPALCHQGPSRAGNALSAKIVDSPPDSATPRWLGATRGIELAGQLYVPQDDPQKTLLGAKVVVLGQHEVLQHDGQYRVERVRVKCGSS
uniref:Uncharacterized protein n=1 Tax=Haptolina ericina TaxID=156174 RepID=A0A7S3BC28_9EUKA|mmetsp:Transcript_56490/g.126182  ORF Transcript_56490/g.126182 Transcript_56490/m.126182 type:complete len:322 (+) Transcript_56490:232-1197(+)